MNNDSDDSRTLNGKYSECRVNCLGKLTPSDLNALIPSKNKLPHFQLHLASR